MNEEKLTFLWQNYANNPDLGFKDYDEFKSLMADDNSRSVFFEASNADLGFQDYDEFNTILGFSSGGGTDMGFTEGSQEPSQQPSQPSEESGRTPYDIRTADVQLGGEPRPSTVLMESGGYDGKEYAYPTLFPKDPNKQTNNPNDWIRLKGVEAFREAKKRGEVWEFDTPQEADEYARGSWKKQEPSQPSEPVLDLTRFGGEVVNLNTDGYLSSQQQAFNKSLGILADTEEPPEEALLENIRKIQQQKNREEAGSQIKTDGGKTEYELELDKLLIKEFPTATGDVYYGAPTIENVEKGKALDPSFSAYMLSRSRQDDRIPEKLRAGAYTEGEKLAFLNDFYNRRTGELQEKVNQTTAVNTAKVSELDKQIEGSKQRLAQTGLFSLDENGNLQSSAANERVDAAIKNMQSAVKEQFMPQFNTLSGEYDQKSIEIKDRIEQLNTQYKESANAAKTQEQLDQINAKYQSDFDALNQELENSYSQYKTAFDNVNSQYEAEASNQYEALKGTLSQEQIDAQSLLDSHNTLIESRNSLVNNVKHTKPFIDLLNVSTKQQSFFNENKPIVERLEERQKEVERLSQGGFTDLVYYEDLGRRALNSLNAFATDFLAAPAGIAVTMEEAVGRGAEYTIADRIVDWADKTRNPLLMGEREFVDAKGNVSVANLLSSATDQLGLIAGLAVGNAYSEARLAQQLSKAPMTTFNKEITKKIASGVNTVVGATSASWNMNLKEAQDMGLSGGELASYVTFMSTLEGTTELIMPNNKIFSKETRDIMLDSFIKNIGKGKRFATKQALARLSEVMGKEAFEEYMVMLGKTVETAAISLENEDIDVYVPTLQEVINTGATAMVAAGGPSMVSQIGLRKDLETAAIIKGSQIDFNQLKSDVSQQVSAGVIDINSANDYLEKVNRQKTINEFVPEDLSLEAKIKLNPIAQQISQLSEQAKDKKGVAKKEIDAKIEQLENDMISIINEDRGISVRIEEPTTVEQYGDKQEVKLKEEEDAVQEREAEEVPVGKVPTPSEEMDQQVREQAAPEKPEASPEERLISVIEAREEAPTLSDSIGKKVFKGDTAVTIRQEGQQIVTDDGTTITELGNIDEIGSATLEEFELKSTPTTGVEITGPRDVIIDGRPAKIISSRVDKKGRRVVKVKDSETGLIARIKGPRAEEIAKDLALQAQESSESLRLIEEGKPVTEPKPIKEKEDLDALTLQEVEQQAKALEEEAKEYENMLLEEAETGMAVGDIEIVEVDGKPYLVKKKRGGEFSITNDKGIGVRGQERANVEAAFDNQQRRAQEQRLEEAAEEAERFRQEQGDKILDILDKAIAATDTRGKLYDATLGLPLFVFNSSLKIVRAAYKAGKTIAEAIQEALDFLNSKGYDVNVNAFKSRITEEIGKTKEAPIVTEETTKEGKEGDFGYRAGDIEGAVPERLGNFRGGRGTGHFGTGYYFFGSEDQAKAYAKPLSDRITGKESEQSRKINKVDFSKYDLLKVKDNIKGFRLHKALKAFQSVNVKMFSRDNITYQKALTELIEGKTNVKEGKSKEIAEGIQNTVKRELETKSQEIADEINAKFPSEDFQTTKEDVQEDLDFNLRTLEGYVNERISADYGYKSMFREKTKLPYGDLWASQTAVDIIDNAISSYIEKSLPKESRIESMLKRFTPEIKELAEAVADIAPERWTASQAELAIKLTLPKILRRDPYQESHMGKTTVGTELIKALGYNGIDVRGVGESQGMTGLDNSTYGSVIYDLKKTKDAIQERKVTEETTKEEEINKKKASREGRTRRDNERLDKVERAVDLLDQSLSSVMPNIVIAMAESAEQFAFFAEEEGYKREDMSKGVFRKMPVPDSKTFEEEYVIVLNPDSADVATVFHEGLHAVLRAAGLSSAQARAVTGRMIDAVKKTATKKLQRELEEFTEMYKTPQQNEEYIAELIGILANNYNEQNNETKSLIRRWLEKLAEILGLKPKGAPLSSVGLGKTDAAIVDTLNFVAQKMREGGVLTEQDLTRLTEVQPEEEEQGDGGEVRTERLAPNGKRSNLDDVGRVYPLGIGKSMLMGIKDDQYKPVNDYEQYFDDKGVFERAKKMGVRVVELTDEMRKSNVLLDVEGGKMLYDNVIAVDPKWLGKSYKGTNVIQHEAAHTYTVGVLLEGDNTKLTPTEIEYKNDINSIFNSNKTFLNSEYGFNNSHEMVAEFLSNSKFRDYIEGNNLNLFQKIKKAVSSFLNKATDLKLSDVLSKYNNYVDSSFNQETQNIKLADGSNKTFDPDAPSIRKRKKKKPQTNNIIDDAFEFADKSNFKNKLEFKKALQERFEKDLPRLREEYGIKDGTALDENLKRYLIDAYLYETLVAIGSYPDAIGWYDYKTRAAMEIMSLIHPEIKTDENAKAIFTMAVAITSNGNKVFDNFKEADRQYTYFKENGKFDSKKSIGTQSAGIKATFKFLNNIIEGVPIDAFVNFLTAEVRAGDLFVRDGAKKKNIVSGYAADTPVYGASVFGPKIGNGFFMNLYGVFDQLTMDRWFMRQYGRLTGTLLESGEKYEAKIKNSRVRLEDAVKTLSDTEKKILLELVPQAKGRITKANIDSLAYGIMKSSMDVDARKKLSSTLKLNEVRKAGNSLSKSLSGEIEAPTASKRAFIIDIFDEVQKRLKEEYGIDMTIADLRAVNWYPEKSLYKAFKADQSSESAATETSDNEQPDYESAAKKLAVETYNISSEKIQDATRGITERGESIAESNRARIEELGTEDQRNNQRAIREAVLKIKAGFELSPTEKFMDSYKTWTIKTKCQ